MLKARDCSQTRGQDLSVLSTSWLVNKKREVALSAVIIQMCHVCACMCVCVCKEWKAAGKDKRLSFPENRHLPLRGWSGAAVTRIVTKEEEKEEGKGGREMWEAASLPVKWIFDCACSFCDITGAEAPGFPTRASLPTIPEVSRRCCHYLSRYHLSLSLPPSLPPSSSFSTLHVFLLRWSGCRSGPSHRCWYKKKLN